MPQINRYVKYMEHLTNCVVFPAVAFRSRYFKGEEAIGFKPHLMFIILSVKEVRDIVSQTNTHTRI